MRFNSDLTQISVSKNGGWSLCHPPHTHNPHICLTPPVVLFPAGLDFLLLLSFKRLSKRRRQCKLFSAICRNSYFRFASGDMHSSFHTTSRPGSGEAKLANSYPPKIEKTKENIEYSFPIIMELKCPAATNLKYKLNV